jgi:hypothetical protein
LELRLGKKKKREKALFRALISTVLVGFFRGK